LKLAFVVQRYGLDIAGGAEYHCRLVAEHLARHADVEVLTTCAADYITWADHYPEGLSTLNGVPVRRFRVKRPRNAIRFAEWSNRVLGGGEGPRPGIGPGEELRWLEEEGPFSPQLVRHVGRHLRSFDLFVFFSYRYYTTYHGLHAAADRSLLVPTAEDDGVYKLSIFTSLFRLPRAIVYNSFEEKAMIEAASGNRAVPSDVVGVGSALPPFVDGEAFRRKYAINGPFVLYIGRIDENKGCRELFGFFRRYVEETGSRTRLVLVGKALLSVPSDPGFVHLGFLEDQDKWNALAASDLLVMPSRLESLSMVTLEAWWSGRPVLANGHCEVLRGQCQRSNGGLYYAGYEEFRESLSLLEGDSGLRLRLGVNGRRYFEENYAWEVVERKYLALLEEARRGSAT
jgi:glycosyltransferase involved in cell wall biosynthesis